MIGKIFRILVNDFVFFVTGILFAEFLHVQAAHAQGRNKLDRPKDSQELCNYTLKEDQVTVLGENNVKLAFTMDGLPVDNAKAVADGPVCAYKVDHPDQDVTIAQIYGQKRDYFAPARVNDQTLGALLVVKKKCQ